MLRRGRCFALFPGSWSDLYDKHFGNCPTLLFLYKLTVGRVKLNFLKMKKSMFTAFAVGLCLAANVMAQVPNNVVTNGLVGYWPFNGNANDESGNGNNGTVNGATLTTDRFSNQNEAYTFSGGLEYISMPEGSTNNLNITGNISISTWFSSTFDNVPLVAFMDNVFGNGGYGFSIGVLSPNKASFFIGNQWYGTNSNNQTDGNWHNLTATLNNGNLRLYFDGILDTTINGVAPPFSWNGLRTLGVGNNPNGLQLNGFYMKGKLDDIGIWNRALTDQEITALYNSCTGNEITSQPTNAVNSIGSNAQFSVNAVASSTYQWQSNPLNTGWLNLTNNSTYSGATTNTLTVSNTTISNHNQPFRAIVNAGGCVDTSDVAQIIIGDTCLTTVTDTLIINTTLGLPAPNNENTILIYPNPASDHITIDNGNYTTMAGYTIKIENNAGQQVFQSLINQAQFYVDLSTWSGNGLYFVHLIDAQGNTVTVRKIVLQ